LKYSKINSFFKEGRKEMHKLDFILADDLYKILEKTFTPEEIEVFINQAVRRQIEETLKIKPTQPPKEPVDDINSHEWTQ
jgi:hypothetical protein